MPMKPTLKLTFVTLTALLLFPSPGPCAAEAAEPHPNLNILIITVDDMSADSVGAFGCRLADTTPNLDRLAAQGMRFTRAQVVCANCMPSRNAMWSGLYPHNNRVEGFYQVPGAKYPHLADLMKRAGYFAAIQHKVSHSTPYSPYPAWDLDLDIGPDGRRRDVKAPRSYGEGTAEVTFDVPAVPGNVVSFAVFVGEDFQTSPQHLQSDPIAVQ